MLQKKRGQHIFGMPFVFIISMIIAALIVIFAIFAIKNFACRGEQIEVNLFIHDLRTEVKKAFSITSLGSQTIFERSLPTKGCTSIELVCFALPGEEKTNAEISDSVWFELSAYKEQDVQLFLYPRKGLQEVGVQQAYNINPERSSITLERNRNPTCFENTGKIKIFLNNEGKNVLIHK